MYKDYNLNESVKLGYEKAMMDDFSNYGGIIGDAITEIADNYVSIYNSELWEISPKIRYFIEEAMGEFGISNEIDLIKIFQMGQYYYNVQLLYDNLEILIFNYAIEYLEMNYPKIFTMLTKNLENYIEEILLDIDNNSYMEDIDTIIDDNIDYILLEALKEGCLNIPLTISIIDKEMLNLVGGLSILEYSLLGFKKEFEYEKNKYSFSYGDKFNLYFTILEETPVFGNCLVKITEIELI